MSTNVTMFIKGTRRSVFLHDTYIIPSLSSQGLYAIIKMLKFPWFCDFDIKSKKTCIFANAISSQFLHFMQQGSAFFLSWGAPRPPPLIWIIAYILAPVRIDVLWHFFSKLQKIALFAIEYRLHPLEIIGYRRRTWTECGNFDRFLYWTWIQIFGQCGHA